MKLESYINGTNFGLRLTDNDGNTLRIKKTRLWFEGDYENTPKMDKGIYLSLKEELEGIVDNGKPSPQWRILRPKLTFLKVNSVQAIERYAYLEKNKGE